MGEAMLSFKEMVGSEAVNRVKQLPLYDITDIEEKERWQFLFTKINRDRKYTSSWVEDRLLFYERGDLDLILRAYKSGFSFDYQDGKLETMMGGGAEESSRNKVKDKLNWEEGSTLVLIPIGDGKAEFQLIKTSELNISQQKPVTKDKEKEIIMPFIEEARSVIKVLRDKFDDGNFSVQSELEKQQAELVSLTKWLAHTT